MYTLPFEILKNKVPFLEFLWRNIKFLLKPKVEKVQNFRTGESRYALWDLLMSLSLTTLIYSIGYMITSDEYYQSAQRLLTQTNLIFSLGFYALPTIITFTAIIFLIFLLKMDKKSAIDSSIVCSMFFVRVYALFLLFIIPLIIFTIDLLSSEVKTINEFIENHLFLSYALLICNVAFLFWVLVHPLKVFVFPSLNKRSAYTILLVVIYASTEPGQHIDSPIKLNFDTVFSCEKVYKSERFRLLSEKEKQVFMKNCEL